MTSFETVRVAAIQATPVILDVEATIEKALAAARTVVVCWTPASVASENVRSEARVAREDGRLIQAFLKPCAPPLFFGT